MSFWFYSTQWTVLSSYYGDHIGIARDTLLNWNVILNNLKIIPGFLFWRWPDSFPTLVEKLMTLTCHVLVLGSLLLTFKFDKFFEENQRNHYKLLALTATVIFYSIFFLNLFIFRTQFFSVPTPYIPMISAVSLTIYIVFSPIVKKAERFIESFQNWILPVFMTLILIYGTFFTRLNTDLTRVKNAANPFEVEHFALNLDKELGGGTLAVLWYELYNAPVLQYYRLKNNMPAFRHYTGEAYPLLWSMNYSEEATKAVREGIAKTFEESDFVIIPESADQYFQHEVYALFRQRDFVKEYLNSPNSPQFVVRKVLHDAADVRLLMLQKRDKAPKGSTPLALPYGSTRWSVDPYKDVNTDLIPRHVSQNYLERPSSIAGLIIKPEDRRAYGPFYAFDEVLDTFWEQAGKFPHELKISLEEAIPVGAYQISSGPDNHGAHHRMPSAWILQGSHDNVDWVDLDVQIEQTEWKHREVRAFELKEPVQYKYYRVLFTKGGSPDIIRLYSLELK